MKKYLFIVLLVGFAFGQVSSKFKSARIGYFYEIKGNSALALLLKPEVSIVASENQRNMITVLGNSTYNIEIVKTKGILDRFFYVNIISFGEVKLSGNYAGGGQINGWHGVNNEKLSRP